MKIKAFFSRLKKFDLFAEPVSLTFDGKKKISTNSGLFLSFLLLTLLIFLCHSKFESIINRSTVYIQTFEKVNRSPPPLSLKNKFAIKFSPTFLSSTDLKRYFSFYTLMGKIFYLPNGTSYVEKQFFKFVQCNSSHFPMFKKEILIENGIKDWICPDYNNTDADFIVKGEYGDSEYSYLQISVQKCFNTTNVTTCVSDYEFNKMRKSNSKIYMDVVLINNIVDLNDFENPFKPNIEYSYLLFEPNKTFIQKEIYFQDVQVSSDLTQSFNALRFDSNYLYDQSFIFNGKVDQFTMTDISSTGSYFVSLYFRSDRLSKKFVRKYDCFQDYLQSLGSFYSIFFLFFTILNSHFSKPGKLLKYADSLYNFNNSNRNNEKIISDSKGFCRKKFERFILLLFGRSNINGYKQKVVEKQIHSDLDIIRFILSIKRLNNLKTILINDKQKLILDLTGKENFENLILKEQKKLTKFLHSFNSSYSLRKNYSDAVILSKIEESFQSLQKDIKSGISQKICSIIERNEILKNSNHKIAESTNRICFTIKKIPNLY